LTQPCLAYGSGSNQAARLETLWRRPVRLCRTEKARERTPGTLGESRCPQALKGKKPKGAAGVRRANNTAGARDSRTGQSPEAAVVRAGLAALCGVVNQTNNRQVGSLGWKHTEYRRGRGKLRRANPRSAAGAKYNRPGFGGMKPSRGQPNPEGGSAGKMGDSRHEKAIAEPSMC
jgi:hypothetical protein